LYRHAPNQMLKYK